MPNFVDDSVPFTFSEPCLNFDYRFEQGNFHIPRISIGTYKVMNVCYYSNYENV